MSPAEKVQLGQKERKSAHATLVVYPINFARSFTSRKLSGI